jgi:parallel beta-helix repeat protein
MTSLRLALLALALAAASTAGATTYYVDDTGSNTNPGTLSQPFRTISYSVNQLSAGDTLYVREGTYAESVLIWNRHGSTNAWIVIEPYGSETPTIDAAGKGESGVTIDESSFIYLGNLEVVNADKSGIFVWDAHDINVSWNVVHHNNFMGIHAGTDTYNNTYNIHIEGNEVYDNVRHNINHDASPWYQAVSAYNSHDVQILGNTVYQNYGEGIDYILSDLGTIQGNTSADNFSCNLYLDNATNTVASGNLMVSGWAGTPSDYYRDGNAAIGIAVANEYYYRQNPAYNLTITNNIVLHGNNGFVYWDSQYGGGLDNVTIANNTFIQTDDIELIIEGTTPHSGTVVKNNIFYQTSGVNYAWAPATNISYGTNAWYGGNSGTSKSGTGDVTSSPLFANASGWTADDFKITSSSPCKNAGATISVVSGDYFLPGTARSGTYDIGAHEYR